MTSHSAMGMVAVPSPQVLALSPLSRAMETRVDRKPQLSDLRESGSIEQDADVVMFIYRDDLYRDNEEDVSFSAEIIIGKQPNGSTGSAPLLWRPECARFEEMAPQYRIDQEH